MEVKMIAVKPSYEILHMSTLTIPELAGRTCYTSSSAGNPEKFVRARIKDKHETIIEHGYMSVRFIVDRGFSHELVRHRMAVYSQESTRWCDYAGTGIKVIHPPDLTPNQIQRREYLFWRIQLLYNEELAEGLKPEIARGLLPHALRTEIVMTANFREWRLVFKQRALGKTGRPHPQMKELMDPLLREAAERQPAVFGDLCG